MSRPTTKARRASVDRQPLDLAGDGVASFQLPQPQNDRFTRIERSLGRRVRADTVEKLQDPESSSFLQTDDQSEKSTSHADSDH
jgi:hypothetical protein